MHKIFILLFVLLIYSTSFYTYSDSNYIFGGRKYIIYDSNDNIVPPDEVKPVEKWGEEELDKGWYVKYIENKTEPPYTLSAYVDREFFNQPIFFEDIPIKYYVDFYLKNEWYPENYDLRKKIDKYIASKKWKQLIKIIILKIGKKGEKTLVEDVKTSFIEKEVSRLEYAVLIKDLRPGKYKIFAKLEVDFPKKYKIISTKELFTIKSGKKNKISRREKNLYIALIKLKNDKFLESYKIASQVLHKNNPVELNTNTLNIITESLVRLNRIKEIEKWILKYIETKPNKKARYDAYEILLEIEMKSNIEFEINREYRKYKRKFNKRKNKTKH